VEYTVVGGVPQIQVTVPRNPKLPKKLIPVMGQKMWDAIKEGKPLVIVKGEDSGYDFAVMKSGKMNKPLQAPSITSILDDLDFIEAVRVGDWNGACLGSVPAVSHIFRGRSVFR